VVNCSCPSTNPTPGRDGGGAAGADGGPAGLGAHAAIPAALTAPAAAASCPNARRDIPLMEREYPYRTFSAMSHDNHASWRQSVKSILTDTGVVSSALATLAPTGPNLRPRATTSSSGLNFATPARH